MKLGRLCFCIVIFILVLLAADQAMMRLPAGEGSIGEFRQTYLDLRQNLLQPEEGGAAPLSASPRYVYVDEQGGLHFADSLQEVPSRFRAEAQPLRD